MASLKILSEQPDRLTLGRGGGSPGTLIGVIIFGIITIVALSSLFDKGDSINPVTIIIFLIIGLAVLNSFTRSLSSTRVVLDTGQRVASRTDTLFFVPIRRRELAFNVIRDVQVTRSAGAGAFSLDSLPIWQVQLQGTDGTMLVVNDRGTRAEMDALAAKVSTLLSRPVRTEQKTQPSVAPPTAYTPAAVVSSLYENLVAFAQSAGAANVTPPVVAPSSSAPRLQQEDRERTARRQPQRANTAPAIPANTFTPAPPSIDADAPFLQASQTLAADQLAFSTTNDWNTTSVAYTAPPVLVMPELPAMASFGPALNMPSFPALGITMPSPNITLEMSSEIKEVEAIVTPPPNPLSSSPEALTQYRAARQFLSARNFRDAQTAYLRALSSNPADVAIQNDLGVVYYEQNKLQDAERSFRRALALDPFISTARYNLGIVLHRQGKRSDAVEQFNIGIQNATTQDASYFRDAQRGFLRAPLISPAA